MARINVRELQTPIRQRYKDDPAAAQVRLKVRSTQADLGDPLHCAVLADSTPAINCVVLNTLRYGVPVESAFSLKQA